MNPCADCVHGPSGIAGHEGLLVHKIGRAGVVFHCRQCGFAWARWYAGDGTFTWNAIASNASDEPTAPLGVFVP